MLIRLIYNNKAFKIINEYSIKTSNSDVSFSDIVIDFTGCSLTDIPFKYQEIKIVEAEKEEDILKGKVVFTGFLDEVNLSEMKNKNEDRELTLTLLSPLAMATRRYVSLIGTYQKEEAIKRILQPLIDDGFYIAEMNIENGQITNNFALDTVENCMNNMCCKLNLLWYIDQNKAIFVNSIDYLMQLNPKLIIKEGENTSGIYRIQPQIENIDYSNVINFKNVRVYYEAKTSTYDTQYNLDYPLLNLPKTVKKGDIVQLLNPIVIDEKTLRMLMEEKENSLGINDAFSFSMHAGGKIYSCKIERADLSSSDYDKFIMTDNIGFSDDQGDEKELMLQRDSFFPNLITGFKYNGEETIEIDFITSMTALRYTTMRFMHSNEINKLKGIISNTGIIEKTIDYQEKWATTSELVEYARSLMSANSKTINQVDLESDEKLNLKIGDLVYIYEPDFFIDAKFAVKEINYVYKNLTDQTWKFVLKNSDLNSSYIDLFRSTQTQEEISKFDTVVLAEYIEENTSETHIVEVDNEDM
ncbi:MAG: hypothetical protein J6K45_06545 [Clostridia bacterium]|nr:hypothetical protein [Clostridia bacterium]